MVDKFTDYVARTSNYGMLKVRSVSNMQRYCVLVISINYFIVTIAYEMSVKSLENSEMKYDENNSFHFFVSSKTRAVHDYVP